MPYLRKKNPRLSAGIHDYQDIKSLTHDTSFRVLEEGDDGLDLGAVGHLILDLIDHVKHTGLSMEEQTIGIGDVLLHLLVDASLFHHRGVWTAIRDGLATGDDERGHIVRQRTTGLHHGQTPHTGVGILDGRAGEDGTVVNLTVARNLHAVAEHAMVAHDGVVADMCAFEQEVVVADDRTSVAMGTAVDDDILADNVVITDFHV